MSEKVRKEIRRRLTESAISRDRSAAGNAVIGPGRLEDLPQLTELLHLLFSQESDFQPDARKQRRALRMLLDSPSAGQVLVARQANRVVGMVSLLFTISTAEGGLACWLEDMIIHPACRHCGIGSQLLEHAVAHARSRKIRRITLLTERTNGSAQRFYESHGFWRSPMIPLRLSVRR